MLESIPLPHLAWFVWQMEQQNQPGIGTLIPPKEFGIALTENTKNTSA
jgi:hypothetical protein